MGWLGCGWGDDVGGGTLVAVIMRGELLDVCARRGMAVESGCAGHGVFRFGLRRGVLGTRARYVIARCSRFREAAAAARAWRMRRIPALARDELRTDAQMWPAVSSYGWEDKLGEIEVPAGWVRSHAKRSAWIGPQLLDPLMCGLYRRALSDDQTG